MPKKQSESSSVKPPVLKSRTKPWPHQIDALEFIWDRPGAMLAMGMGTGKSKVVVDLIANKRLHRVLIVCPKAVLDVWPQEFAKHLGASPWRIINLGGMPGAKKAQVAREFKENPAPYILLVNYEAVWREPLASILQSSDFDLVVADESHRIKAPGGKASKYMARLGRWSKRRLALTGTPMPHSPVDIYAQARFLDPSIFGTRVADFRDNYTVMGGFEGRQIIGYKNQDPLANILSTFMYQAKSSDVLDLPPVIHTTRRCVLPPKHRNFYAELEQEMVAEWDGGKVVASNILVKLLRLQQIACGHMRDEEGVDHVLHSAKETLLRDVVQDLQEDEPIVVFYRFKPDLQAIYRAAGALGRLIFKISGEKNQLDEWREQKGMLAVQIQAGSEGIDLTLARYGIYYSLEFNLGLYEQSLARLHRPGQTRPTFYIHLLTQGTVDVRIMRSLQDRQGDIASLMNRIPRL